MEVGFVKSVNRFLLDIDGLPKVRVNDVLESENGARAFVFSLGPTSVQALLMTEKSVRIGEQFKKITDQIAIGVSDELLGRVIGPTGEALDGGKNPKTETQFPLDRTALGISARRFISDQLISGVALVDILIPLGLGQRELVVGDARSGKTSFLLDLIVNLSTKDMICVFASVGRPAAKLWNVMNILAENKAVSKLVTVATFPSDPTPLIYLTPKAAMAVAEYFRAQGKDVLLILDDLGVHARIYREISLLLGRFPGREGYPGDIFYQHSSLVERAGCFSKEAGGGSITALPVIEINLDDFTSYIPTNLMSMTDGHLLFNSTLIAQGKRPGIDVSLSVSRVGRQTQTKVESEISLKIRQIFSQARQFETVAGFGGELPLATRLVLKQKELLEECLKQGVFEFLSVPEQVLILLTPFNKEIQELTVEQFVSGKNDFIKMIREDKEFKELVEKFSSFGKLNEVVAEVEKLKPKVATAFKLGSLSKEMIVDSETWKPKI